MNRAARRTATMLLALSMSVLAAGSARSEAGVAGESPEMKSPEVEVRPVRVKLSDVELLDQNGNRVRFRSDVVKDRIVVIDAIYTTCPLVCPILSAVFADLQDALGDRLGKDVFLVSVSVDPLTDIPARLKEYAARWEAKPGWLFLTGEKGRVDEVLQGLGAYTADFTDHSAMVLVGDGRSGDWTRFFGFPSVEAVASKLAGLDARRRGKSEVPK